MGVKAIVSPEPDIERVQLTPGKSYGLVLASDGLWDVFSNNEVALRVKQLAQENASNIAQSLVEEAIDRRGSMDNTSAIVDFIRA